MKRRELVELGYEGTGVQRAAGSQAAAPGASDSTGLLDNHDAFRGGHE